MSTYKTTVTPNTIKISLVETDYTVSLSRTGGQGTKGDSVKQVLVDSNNDLIITLVDGADQIIQIFNAGNIFQNAKLQNLIDVENVNPSDGDVLIYEGSSSTYKLHSFTTTNLIDVDNSGKTDGAMFLYDASSSKYKATTQINNANTVISGGTF